MAREPVTNRGRATRDRIIVATTAVLGESGPRATRLDEVCARARVSRSQLYHFFSDKDDLIRAVIAAINDQVVDAHIHMFTEHPTWEGLRTWADTLVAAQAKRKARGGCPIGSLVPQLAEHDARARAALAQGFDRWEEALRDGFTAMRDDGLLGAGTDTAWLAGVALAGLQGGLVLTQARRDPQQLRIALDGVIHLVEVHEA